MTTDSPTELGYWGRRVLILGASGFIGRWLARRLTAEGARVYLVVRNIEAARGVAQRFGIEGEIIGQDLEQRDAVYKLFDQIKPSITFNLVDFGPEQAETDQARAHEINSDLVLAICEGIAGNRDRSWEGQDIVQLGSAAEYGTEHTSWDEESEPLPTTIYGQSKLSGTRFLKNSSRAYGLKSITARVFSVYGPGEGGRGLLPALLATARSGGDLRLRASQAHRDWTYVGDVAEGLCRLGLVRSTEPGVVNLASGRWTSVHEFIQHAARALKLADDKVRLIVEGERGDIRPTSVPLWRLHDLTGWVPTTSPEEGIARTLEFEKLLDPKIVEVEPRISPEWGGAN